MRIARLALNRFRQFQGLDIPLLDPVSGQALRRVCFLGRNGTGKSTLLRIIRNAFNHLRNALSQTPPKIRSLARWPLAGLKIETEHGGFWIVDALETETPATWLFRAEADNATAWEELFGGRPTDEAAVAALQDWALSDAERGDWAARLNWRDESDSIVVYVPPDVGSSLPNGQPLPQTTLDAALERLKRFPLYHEISTADAAEFWDVLIYHIKQREAAWQTLLDDPANQAKSIEAARREFDAGHPEILAAVAELWNRLLAPAGLEFDPRAARKPVQLRDNLEAFVTVKATGKRLGYDVLSSGMRLFLFRVGHLLSLYFDRPIARGFLLFDEPENSLFPDFLYDQIGIYESILRNTQFFAATHSPIIAAQFRPEERVLLDFDDTYQVRARHGWAPVGDDPNDMLLKDFEVRSIYPAEGLKNWERGSQLAASTSSNFSPRVLATASSCES